MKIPFKSKLSRVKDIEKRNKVFNSMQPEDQRKEIAYDALILLVKKKIQAESGIYWDYNFKNKTGRLSTPKALQKFVCKDSIECNVCARGAIMLSQIRLGNTVDPSDSKRSVGSHDNLRGFDIKGMDNMENEFEGFTDDEKVKYDIGTNEKLACILSNVIINGDFKKSDRTDYVKKWKLKV